MQKFGNDDEAILYYAQETIAIGWSRDLLTNTISIQMHLRKNDTADNNFALTLLDTESTTVFTATLAAASTKPSVSPAAYATNSATSPSTNTSPSIKGKS